MLSVQKVNNFMYICCNSIADVQLFFTTVRKIAIFDGSRVDDRWLDTSANPGSFPGVASDAPSASGVALSLIFQILALHDRRIPLPRCTRRRTRSRFLGAE
jgi:hypothetical protein